MANDPLKLDYNVLAVSCIPTEDIDKIPVFRTAFPINYFEMREEFVEISPYQIFDVGFKKVFNNQGLSLFFKLCWRYFFSGLKKLFYYLS
jgi:hypothetical protein